MSQIQGPPNTYDAGLLFDYAVWTSSTVLTMANVPWNNDYRDVVRFSDGRTGLNTFIDSQASSFIQLDRMRRAKFDEPIRISTPFNRANRYNYIRASNPIQPLTIGGADIQKDYYYFILSCVELTPNTTQITVELDVWQTFGYDVTMGNCYIERGHIGIANSNAFDSFGRDYLTSPEGLDVGGEYRTISTANRKIMTNSFGGDGNLFPVSEPGYDILVCSTVDLFKDYGTVAAPVLNTAGGGVVQGLSTGATFYVFAGAGPFSNFMRNTADKPWITQGITSITLIPRVKRYLPNFKYAVSVPGTVQGAEAYCVLAPAFSFPTLTHSAYPAWRDALVGKLPVRYQHLKKFFTYPYMVIEMTTWGATPIVIKPESWGNADALITEQAAIVPPGQRVVLSPQSYNADSRNAIEQKRAWYGDVLSSAGFPGDLGDGDDGGDYLDFTTVINNFPTMAIVNNSGIAYMASNAASLNYQNSSADWAQQRANAGSMNSYDANNIGVSATGEQGMLSRGANSQANSISTNAANQSMLANGITGIISGAAGGAVAGPGGAAIGAGMGAIGAVAGAVNTGIQTDASAQQTRLQNGTSQASQNVNTKMANQIAGNNLRLANFSAKGDYAQTIAGINSKVQDAKLVQPSTSGQIGGEAFNLVNNNVEVSLRWKLIDNASIRRVGEYWLRYGYAVMQSGRIPSSFMVMSKFTYWKLSETYITGAPMPEVFKQAIRGIFEKGVTVWANPLDIGQIDWSDNTPLTGVSLN